MKIEEMGFKQIFISLYLPIAMLVSLDLITTYYGVCVLGGIELNPIGTLITKDRGFLILLPYQFGTYGLFIAGFSFFIRMFSKWELWRLIFLILFVIVLLDYVDIIIYNLVGILHEKTGFDVVSQSDLDPITNETLQEIQQEFEPNRNDFCRLL